MRKRVSKLIRTSRQDQILTQENYIMREISERLYDKIKQRDIYWSEDEMEILGNLNFTENE